MVYSNMIMPRYGKYNPKPFSDGSHGIIVLYLPSNLLSGSAQSIQAMSGTCKVVSSGRLAIMFWSAVPSETPLPISWKIH